MINLREAHLRYAAHYETLLRTARELYHQGNETRALALFDDEWENIQRAQAWVEQHITESGQIAAICCNYAMLSFPFLRLRCNAGERIEWLNSGLAAVRYLVHCTAQEAYLNDFGTALFALALNKNHQALARYMETRRAEADILDNFGRVYAAIGETRLAIGYYNQALAIHREIKDRHNEGITLSNLAAVYEQLNLHHHAIKYYDQSNAIFRELDAQESSLALTYLNMGETQRALEVFERDLRNARRSGQRYREAIALSGLGMAYFKLDKMARAIEAYEQSLVIAREINDPFIEAQNVNNLGMVYLNSDEPQRALKYFRERVASAQKLSDPLGEAVALANMAHAFDHLGERTQTIAHAEAALEIFERTRDPRAASLRMELAEWRETISDFEDLLKQGAAKENLELGQQIWGEADLRLVAAREQADRRGEGEALAGLAIALSDMGEHRHAIELYNQSLSIAHEVGDREGECRAVGNMGVAYKRLGEVQRAIECYQQQLNLAREIGYNRGEGLALFNLGRALHELGEREQAIAYAEAALKIYRQIKEPRTSEVIEQIEQWRGRPPMTAGVIWTNLNERRERGSVSEQERAGRTRAGKKWWQIWK